MATLSASSSSSPMLDERRPPESSPPATPTVPRKGSKKKRKLPKLISFSEQQMKLAFSILDEDQDGLVNASELLTALKKLGLEDCVDERVAVSLLKDATKSHSTSSSSNSNSSGNSNKSSSSSSSSKVLSSLVESNREAAAAAATSSCSSKTTTATATLQDELMSESQFLDWLPKLASYATPSNLVPSSPVTPPSPVSPSPACGNLLATADADLKAAFSVFDKDKDGYISRSELRSAMTLMKEKVTDHELDQVMSEADLDRDGRISFDEFARLMLR